MYVLPLFFYRKKRDDLVRISRAYYANLRVQWPEKSVVQYMADMERVLGDEACLITYYIRDQEWVEQTMEAAKQELVVNYVKAFVQLG